MADVNVSLALQWHSRGAVSSFVMIALITSLKCDMPHLQLLQRALYSPALLHAGASLLSDLRFGSLFLPVVIDQVMLNWQRRWQSRVIITVSS